MGESGEFGGEGESFWNPRLRKRLHFFLLACSVGSTERRDSSEDLMGVLGGTGLDGSGGSGKALAMVFRGIIPSHEIKLPEGGTIVSFRNMISLRPGAGKHGAEDGTPLSPLSAVSRNLVRWEYVVRSCRDRVCSISLPKRLATVKAVQ